MPKDYAKHWFSHSAVFAAAVVTFAVACGNEVDGDPGVDDVVALDDPPSSATTTNLLTNGSFESGISPWHLAINNGAGTLVVDTTTRVAGAASAKLTVTQSAGNTWDLPVYQPGLAVSSGRQYTVSFYAKANAWNRQVTVSVAQAYSPYSSYYSQTFSLSRKWRQYTFSFTQPVSDVNAEVVFESGQAPGVMWLDAVSLTSDSPAQSPSIPPPLPSNGAPVPDITNFTSDLSGSFKIDGHDFGNDLPNSTYSLTAPDTQTLRFELHPGDRYCTASWCDPSTSERAEVSGYTTYDPDTTFNIAYNFQLAPGVSNTAPWMATGQLHDVPGNYTQPFDIVFEGDDHMRVLVGWFSAYASSLSPYWHPTIAGQPASYAWAYVDPNPIERGRYYNIQISARFDNAGGYLLVVRDGVTIVDYHGPLGFGFPHFWKMGIYRGAAPESQVAYYNNFVISP